MNDLKKPKTIMKYLPRKSLRIHAEVIPNILSHLFEKLNLKLFLLPPTAWPPPQGLK